MSTTYNLEPPTKGKVVLKTTMGDVEIELWPKEAPKAVRNFVQLCLEGYYDNTIFHRILKDSLIQGGDPEGTGTGGDSIYGKPFKDEFHSRLKFTHRGIVACANANQPHTNNSQFFITLGRCDGLDKKHTIFGKVTGDTIYNVANIGELEVGDDDRPLHPPRIKETEVLWNPFEDIVPRSTKEEREARAQAARAAEAPVDARPAKWQKKNLALLSFEEEEEGAEPADAHAPTKIRSAHDVIQDRRFVATDTDEGKALAEAEAEAERERARVRASVRGALAAKQAEEEAARPAEDDDDTHEQDGDQGDFAARMRAKVAAKQKAVGADRRQAAPKGNSSEEEDSDRDDASDGVAKQGSTMQRRDDMLRTSKSKAAMIKPSRQIDVEDAELLNAYQRKQQEYKQRKKLTQHREKDTLARLAKFGAALKSAQGSTPKPATGGEPGAPAVPGEGEAQQPNASSEGYAGKVRTDVDHDLLKPAAWRVDSYLDEDDDGGLQDLRGHVLKFAKDPNKKDEMARTENVDDYVVHDPVLEAGKAAYNKAQARKQKRERSWAGKAVG